jgi:hypothetical protein
MTITFVSHVGPLFDTSVHFPVHSQSQRPPASRATETRRQHVAGAAGAAVPGRDLLSGAAPEVRSSGRVDRGHRGPPGDVHGTNNVMRIAQLPGSVEGDGHLSIFTGIYATPSPRHLHCAVDAASLTHVRTAKLSEQLCCHTGIPIPTTAGYHTTVSTAGESGVPSFAEPHLPLSGVEPVSDADGQRSDKSAALPTRRCDPIPAKVPVVHFTDRLRTRRTSSFAADAGV